MILALLTACALAQDADPGPVPTTVVDVVDITPDRQDVVFVALNRSSIYWMPMDGTVPLDVDQDVAYRGALLAVEQGLELRSMWSPLPGFSLGGQIGGSITPGLLGGSAVPFALGVDIAPIVAIGNDGGRQGEIPVGLLLAGGVRGEILALVRSDIPGAATPTFTNARAFGSAELLVMVPFVIGLRAEWSTPYRGTFGPDAFPSRIRVGRWGGGVVLGTRFR